MFRTDRSHRESSSSSASSCCCSAARSCPSSPADRARRCASSRPRSRACTTTMTTGHEPEAARRRRGRQEARTGLTLGASARQAASPGAARCRSWNISVSCAPAGQGVLAILRRDDRRRGSSTTRSSTSSRALRRDPAVARGPRYQVDRGPHGHRRRLHFQLKISLVVGILISSPVWIWQIWAFVLPAMHRNEKRWALLLTATGAPLFVARRRARLPRAAQGASTSHRLRARRFRQPRDRR